jgi:hypothetical protein
MAQRGMAWLPVRGLDEDMAARSRAGVATGPGPASAVHGLEDHP